MSKSAGKWILVVLVVMGLGLGIFYVTRKDNNKINKTSNETSNSNQIKELPLPEITGGSRGELGIDKNINESNIDEYLDREDSVYRDMRMLEDPAKYESIGGDRFLSGYIKGFEVTPLPYIIPVEGLPAEVGKTYSGKTLFSLVDGKYVANYEESMSIIEKIFPKDKVIFLMCGGGGYAGMTKNFLVQMGWDENKIYNIGGYWYYEGKNKVEVKKNGTKYDFSDVPYNEINFDKLTFIDRRVVLPSEYYNYEMYTTDKNSVMYKIDSIDTRDGTWVGHQSCGTDNPTQNCFKDRSEEEYEKDVNTAIKMKGDYINNLMKEKKSFIVVVHAGDTCIAYGNEADSFERYINEYLIDKKIFRIIIGLKPLKESDLYKTVKYNPAVIIVKNGEIYKYIDANMNEFTKLSKDKKASIKWLEDNVVIK